MDQNAHNIDNEESDKNSDESTITQQTSEIHRINA